ncbi:MAG: hypothetical protein ABI810_20765, partial [Sphingomonas bacterium]
KAREFRCCGGNGETECEKCTPKATKQSDSPLFGKDKPQQTVRISLTDKSHARRALSIDAVAKKAQ